MIGSLNNFVPERIVRGYEGMQRIPVEDGAVALVEFASGAQGMLQTSYIAVGNYPGVELRVYGSKGAAVARLVEEFGIAETLHFATPDAVEFRKIDLPDTACPPGTTLHTPWPELYYRNLVRFLSTKFWTTGPANAPSTTAPRARRRSTPSCSRSRSGAGWICRRSRRSEPA